MSAGLLPPTPMLTDIMRQPPILQALFARRQEFAAIGRTLAPGKSATGSWGRLHVFGCGDGWFAARAVAAVASRAFGVAYSAATSLEMIIDPDRALRPEDRAIAISMSGSVDRTNAAASAWRDAGGRCVALSNEDGGALGRIADAVASLHVPDIAPFLTGTTRYSATILALMLIIEGAGGGGICLDRDMQALLDDGLHRTLERADRFCRGFAPALAEAGFAGVRILGAGADWASADYGAAKLVKLVAQPVWSGEIEEFAHSQFWSANRHELVVLLAGSREAALLAENTAAALAAAGMRTLAIETCGEPVASATWRLSLPTNPAWLSPLAMPAPLQLLAYHLAVATGRNPDVSQDVDDPGRFLAAQMLSRRTELMPEIRA